MAVQGTVPEVIVSKGIDQGFIKEAEAGGTISPGDLVDLNSSGQVVALSATADFTLRVALPKVVVDSTTGNNVTVDYSSGENVRYVTLTPGMEFHGRLGANEDIAIGDALESAGDGTITEPGTTPTEYIGDALEAVTTGGSDTGWVRVEVGK